MKTRLMLIASALMASLICLPASAQPAPGMGPDAGPGMMQGKGQGPHGPRDCKQSPNPAACQDHSDARAKAIEACKEHTGQQHRHCMREQRQNFDCSKSSNPQQCEAHKTATNECQGQKGPAFRQCMEQSMPPEDCSKTPNQARCEQHQQAREACKDKPAPEHMNCMREQLKAK
jgi:hypothetical protein